MIDVLIVEDSKVARQHLRHILESDRLIRVIGMAENGMEAVEFVERRKPSVITMDVNMPGMDGLQATRRIMETRPVPIVIVSASYSRRDVQKSFSAMEAGAIAIADKPVGVSHPDYETASRELIQTVKLMSEVKVVKRWSKTRLSKPQAVVTPDMPDIAVERIKKSVNLIAIGASTGGPPVINTILSGLKQGLDAPVMVVQHIAKGFLDGMVDWLNQSSPLHVKIARDREHLMPGHVYFAPDDFHMGVARGNRVVLSRVQQENNVRPSVSYLFRSATSVFGDNMIGVLLSGMGKDGAEELRQMKERGAITIAQDRESSAVYGMPGEAVRINGATYVLSPEKIAGVIGIITNRNCNSD